MSFRYDVLNLNALIAEPILKTEENYAKVHSMKQEMLSKILSGQITTLTVDDAEFTISGEKSQTCVSLLERYQHVLVVARMVNSARPDVRMIHALRAFDEAREQI